MLLNRNITRQDIPVNTNIKARGLKLEYFDSGGRAQSVMENFTDDDIIATGSFLNHQPHAKTTYYKLISFLYSIKGVWNGYTIVPQGKTYFLNHKMHGVAISKVARSVNFSGKEISKINLS